MQSLDNFRLSTYGLENGGLFQKHAHELQSEADVNGGPVGLVMQDGLTIRENFCDLINKIWGLNVSVRKAENILANEQQVEEDGELPEENKSEQVDGGNENEQ